MRRLDDPSGKARQVRLHHVAQMRGRGARVSGGGMTILTRQRTPRQRGRRYDTDPPAGELAHCARVLGIDQ